MTDLHDLTHDELDALADEQGVPDEDYPSSGNKDDKVDALTAAGVTAPEDGPDDDTATSDAVAPTAAEDERAATIQTAVNEGRTGLDPVLAEQRAAAREAEGDTRPARASDRTVDVVDPDGRLERDRENAREVEGRTTDVREGTPEA